MTVEIFASFLVLFGVLSLYLYNHTNYKQPLGYEYENVWAVYFSNQDMPDSLFRQTMERVKQRVKSYPEVAAASQCSNNTPFSMSTWSWIVGHEDKKINADFISSDEEYGNALSIGVSEGRWFNRGENSGGQSFALINRNAKEALFGDEPALGKSITLNGDEKYRIVGIVDNFKPRGEYQKAGPVIFANERSVEHALNTILVKVKPGVGAEFESSLLKELNATAKGVSIEVSHVIDQRRTQHNLVKVPMLVAFIVCGFLLLNVGMGLFGVLWYNIRKRREEIGLRRAMGASHHSIIRQFVGEALVIGVFGMLAGLFFAVQMPLLDVFGLDQAIYFKAIAITTLVLFALVALCAAYPSLLASKVQPAQALHEE